MNDHIIRPKYLREVGYVGVTGGAMIHTDGDFGDTPDNWNKHVAYAMPHHDPSAGEVWIRLYDLRTNLFAHTIEITLDARIRIHDVKRVMLTGLN